MSRSVSSARAGASEPTTKRRRPREGSSCANSQRNGARRSACPFITPIRIVVPMPVALERNACTNACHGALSRMALESSSARTEPAAHTSVVSAPVFRNLAAWQLCSCSPSLGCPHATRRPPTVNCPRHPPRTHTPGRSPGRQPKLSPRTQLRPLLRTSSEQFPTCGKPASSTSAIATSNLLSYLRNP
eukprot:scaffold22359_cov63-Phaeocystis_antarctica.AAC.2